MPDPIWLNGQRLTPEQLFSPKTDDLPLSEFGQEVVQFYRDWHSGKKEFKFQTSGTTGPPKNITFHRNDLVHSAKTTLSAFNLNPGDNILLCLSPRFVAGKMMMVRAFIGRLNLIAVEPTGNPLLKVNQSIDFMAITPQQLFNILADNNTSELFHNVKKVIVGGGPVSVELEEMLLKCKNEIYHTYAMTETLTHIALRKISGLKEEVYTVLPGFEIATDERDCLIIKAPYYEDWLVTNDIVTLESSNSFKWKGRFDNVINSGGIKIFPEELEPIVEQLFQKEGITNRFFLFGQEDNKFGQKLILAIEGALPIEKEVLLAKLKQGLPPFKTPKAVLLCGQFETTVTGKVNRKATLQKTVNDA